jgi:hypothetical protein
VADEPTAQPLSRGWVAATWVIQNEPKLTPKATSRSASTSGRPTSQSTSTSPASNQLRSVT